MIYIAKSLVSCMSQDPHVVAFLTGFDLVLHWSKSIVGIGVSGAILEERLEHAIVNG